MKNGFKKYLRILGPGLVTGAADNDPSGIATYSQTGAKFGYGQLWVALVCLPLMVAIQELCARIGGVQGKGIADVIRYHYGKKVLYPVLLLILIANTINIGADLGAMVAAFQLIIPLNFTFLICLFSVAILIVQILIKYKAYANILKYLCLFLLAYPITIFIVHPPWLQIVKATFIPHIEFNFEFLFITTGILGTTISPYMFFWQSSQIVEEEHAKKMIRPDGTTRMTARKMENIKLDNFVGMLFSQITAWAIIVVTATVLNAHGIKEINTAADAAKALEPFVQSFPHAGFLAKLIFAAGIIGLGLLAIPVLSGSSAYAICEAFKWNKGLNLKFKSAQGFYTVMILSTMVGLLLNFIGINPIKALIYSAVINGVVAVPLIFIIALIGNNKKIMATYKSSILSNIFVFLTFICMGAAAVCMFISIGKP